MGQIKSAQKNKTGFTRSIHEFFSRDQKRYYRKIIKIYSKYNVYYMKKRTPLTVFWLGYYTVLRNIKSAKRNIWLLGKFGNNLKICHANVVVARTAKIGNNVTFHGNNCIGVKSDEDLRAPIIGDNVDIGYGAILIGPITIANGVKIGAGSVVVKDVIRENSIVVGNPGKIIK